MRKKAPRGLVGALIQRHLGFPDAHTGCYEVIVVAVTFAVVVAVFVVVVAVANDDVTIVTCVTCVLLFTCSGCRAGLPPSPPGAFCSWHARALVRLLGRGAALVLRAQFDSWVGLAVHANTCYKQRLGYLFVHNIEQTGFGLVFWGLAEKSNMK